MTLTGTYIVLIIHLFFIGLIRHSSSRSQPTGLYNSFVDDLVILEANNFARFVYNDTRVWVVEFYLSWCGTCINYAPMWKKFASDVKYWKTVVSIGAVDCASEDNSDLCRQFHMKSYPTILVLPPKFLANDLISNVSRLDAGDASSLKEKVLDFIVSLQTHPPASWPSLQPLKSLGNVWERVTKRQNLVLVVFEKETSSLGLQVLLDLVEFSDVFVVRMKRKEAVKLGMFVYPSLYLISRNSALEFLVSGTGSMESDRRRFVDKVTSMLRFADARGRRILIPQNNSIDKQVRSSLTFERRQNVTGAYVRPSFADRVYYLDLESALRYSLWQEIGICDRMEGAELDALRQFVFVLVKFFPGRESAMTFLQNLLEWLLQVAGGLTGGDWLRKIDALQAGYGSFPKEVRWFGCRGSLSGFRGYPCALWSLFHTLTVSALEKTLAEVGDEVSSAVSLPSAIQGYVRHFFGCQQCSRHFLLLTSHAELEVRTAREAVSWLWAVHNKVNKRLHGDSSEDPSHPKVQFPPPHLCPDCFHGNLSTANSGMPDWGMDAVVIFLLRLYGRGGIVFESDPSGHRRIKGAAGIPVGLPEVDRQGTVLFRNKSIGALKLPNDTKRHFGSPRLKLRSNLSGTGKFPERVLIEGVWGFSRLDIGVCVLFYAASVVVLLLVGYYIAASRRRLKLVLPTLSYH